MTRKDAQLEVVIAQRDRALDSVQALVRRLERISGYSTYDEQTDLMKARALLAEER
jgi:hypothetical protein